MLCAVVDEVIAPDMVAVLRSHQHLALGTDPSFLGLASGQLQAFILPDAVHALLVDLDARPMQQMGDAWAAVTLMLIRQLSNLCPQNLLMRPCRRLVPSRGTSNTYQRTGLSFRVGMLLLQMAYTLPFGLRAHHSFPSRSFRASMSSACCATIFLRVARQNGGHSRGRACASGSREWACT